MTTRVGSIGAAQSASYATTPEEIKKKKQDKKDEAILTFGLPEGTDYSKKADRKRRQEELTKQYSGLEAKYRDERADETLTDKLSDKEAKKFAKRQVDNEKRYQHFLNTQSFMSKEEYEAAVKAQKAGTGYQNVNLEYIKDEDVRNWVENNKHKFYKDGKFSSDLYKQEMANWVGTDYKMNLDERAAVSAGGDRMSKGDAKKAAQYAGIDVEKDLTWLKKAGVFVATEAAGAGIGAVTGGIVTGSGNFHSRVDGIHNDGTIENLGEQHSKTNAKVRGRQIGAWAGAIGALPAAILAAAQAKDNGEKDVFRNADAEKVVKDPDGIKNVTEKDGCRTIVRAILALPNLTENEKIATLEYAYGKNTGKTVNRNELIAAYEAAKKINDLPQPTEPTAPTGNTEPTGVTQPTAPTGTTAPTVPTGTTEPTTVTTPTVNTTPTEPEPPKYPVVTVQNGESIARLAKKYGVSQKEIMELNKDKLRYFKSATDCGSKKYLGFLVGAQIKLPENANEEAVKKNQETNSAKENAKYRKSVKKLDGKLCPDRTKTYKTMDEGFRKKNKIRTKEEAAIQEQKAKEQQNGQKSAMTDEEFRKKYPYIAKPATK